MSRYSVRYADARSAVRSGHDMRKTGHRPDALERQRSPTVRLDDTIRRIDNKADAVRKRPVEIPENSADLHDRMRYRAPRVTQRVGSSRARVEPAGQGDDLEEGG